MRPMIQGRNDSIATAILMRRQSSWSGDVVADRRRQRRTPAGRHADDDLAVLKPCRRDEVAARLTVVGRLTRMPRAARVANHLRVDGRRIGCGEDQPRPSRWRGS
jgi:hypothetical protein